jgi:hypothetical protein
MFKFPSKNRFCSGEHFIKISIILIITISIYVKHKRGKRMSKISYKCDNIELEMDLDDGWVFEYEENEPTVLELDPFQSEEHVPLNEVLSIIESELS